VLQVSVGRAIRVVPLDEIPRVEAADQYVRMLTAGGGRVPAQPLPTGGFRTVAARDLQ